MLYGIDVSYANGTVAWPAVKASGKAAFVYSRVCYGSNPADDDGPIFVANHDGCKAQALPFGAYMFWLMGEDGAAQAEHFLAAANGRYGELLPMVDVEEDSGAQGWGDSAQARIENLATTLDAIEKNLGQPLVYCNANTWDTYFGGTDAFSGHKLWVANYPAPPGQPAMPQGWESWVVHQYQSGPSDVPGISGNLDLDCLNGDSLSVITR